MMLKILHIVWSAEVGGITTLIHSLTKEQVKNPSIKVGILLGKDQRNCGDSLGDLGLDVHCIGFRSGFEISKSKMATAVRIMKEYDVLHYHAFNQSLALAGVLSTRRIVYTKHGGVLGHPSNGFIRSLIKRQLMNYFLRHHVRLITVNSDFTRRVALRWHGLPEMKVKLVYNGVPVSEIDESSNCPISKRELGIDNNSVVVGASSRFVGWKRIERLIQAFSIASQSNQRLVLLLIGDGPLRNNYESLISALGISEKVVFCGFRKDVHSIVRMMDVFVMPSEGEPFGLAAIEAMVLGVPVIVFQDGGGLLEIVRRGEFGVIVENEAELSNAILNLLNNKATRKSIGQKASRFARQNFHIQKMEQTLEIIYRGALSS